MRTPVLALAVLAAATAVPGASHAAPARQAKVCKLVIDDKGDVYAIRTAPQQRVPDDALDIVSADVATNATTLTAVIRVAKLTLPPPTSPSGATYELQFNVSGSTDLFYINGVNTAGAEKTYDFGYRTSAVVTSVAASLATPTGVFDTAKNEIRVSVPLSAFGSRAKVKPGSKISGMEVLVARSAKGRGPFADEATATKSYTANAPSCVAVGK